MNITSPSGKEYEVLKLIGKTDAFNLYECQLPDGSIGILKIATIMGCNGLLDREAYILRKLTETAERIEVEAKEREPEKKGTLGYRHYFPDLVESFVDLGQGNRRLNILSFTKNAKELGDLVPLGRILSHDHLRVDPKTSVWILGRLLKLLDFAHMQGISLIKITGENILINREQHHVAIFDWTGATIGKNVTQDVAREEISRVTQEVILALGGDPDTGKIPPDEQLTDDSYQTLLNEFSCGSETNAREAHQKFYKLVRSMWPSKFYPFTAYPVNATKPKTASVETEVAEETE